MNPTSTVSVEERRPADRCSICHDVLDARATRCSACATEHHASCRDELARCPTLGCTDSTKPRITVSPRLPRGRLTLVALASLATTCATFGALFGGWFALAAFAFVVHWLVPYAIERTCTTEERSRDLMATQLNLVVLAGVVTFVVVLALFFVKMIVVAETLVGVVLPIGCLVIPPLATLLVELNHAGPTAPTTQGYSHST